jgi:hypothetical protein
MALHIDLGIESIVQVISLILCHSMIIGVYF